MAEHVKPSKISKRGAATDAALEAIYLYAYPDPATGGEPWTIGAGHTALAGPPSVRPGDTITMEHAIRLMKQDAAKFEKRVRQAVPGVEFQHEFDALYLFDKNTGSLIKGSVDDKLNRGDRAGAMNTLELYVNAAGKRMRGLEIRRAKERAIFERGIYPGDAILVRDRPGAKPRYIAAAAFPWDDVAPAPQIDVKLPAPASIPPLPVRRPNGNFLIDLWNLIRRFFA